MVEEVDKDRDRGRVTKCQTTPHPHPHTMTPVPVPTTKAICRATTTDMGVRRHLKTLTIRIIPLLVHTLRFQNSLVHIRIIHPTKVRSEAMIEVFVSCTARSLLSQRNAIFCKEPFVFLPFHQVHRYSKDIL